MLNLPPRVWREIKSYDEWVQKSHNSEEDWIFHALLHAFVQGDEVVSKTGDPTIYVQDTNPDDAKKGDLWFNTTTEKWYPLTGLSRLFHTVMRPTGKIYELCGSTVISSSPIGGPMGVGGTFDRLFYIAPTKIYELNPDNFTIITSNVSPGTASTGVGGMSDRLFISDSDVGALGELNTTNLTVISATSSPDTAPSGIGGTSNRLFNSIANVNRERIHELNPDNFASIFNNPSPGAVPTGIGGLFDRLFHCGAHVRHRDFRIYELNPDNFAVIASDSSPGESPSGIGGLKLI